MTEYYISVSPDGKGKELIFKTHTRLWAEWLKNQLKRLGHTSKVEKA